MADLIPLFPLSHVLMPGLALPLHIFESRYRTMLRDVSEGGSKCFGIIALRSGAESGGAWGPGNADSLMPVGTLAEVLEVQPWDDGASDLLTVGSRRFRVVDLVTEGTPYLRGRVEWIEEADGDLDAALLTVTQRLCRAYIAKFTRITGRVYDEDLPQDANLLSYHVAGRLPLPLADRQCLLEEETAADRLRLANRLLHRELCLLQATSSVAVAPPVLQLAAHRN